MKKVAKRVSAILSLLILLLSLVPANVRAAENTEERIAINVQVPDDWENPCLWAWDEDGNNAFEAWPGGETEVNPSNDGWYYVWIPTWANHVIVNANEGNVQTEEIILENSTDTWITVTEDSYEVSYDALTEGETPAYVEKFLIHASVDTSWENPCLWAWSAPDGTNAFDAWPGVEMSLDEDGWYTAKAPTWVNSIIINGNEGSVQTEDLSIDPAEIWVTVDAEGNADFSYVDPSKAEVANVTIHVIAPDDWENPCLWAWSAPDGTNVFASWPGENFEEADGWLVKEVPGWVNSIIVNGNEGSVQTSDISIDAEKDVWLVVTDAENYEVYYEEPSADTTTESNIAEESTEIESGMNTTALVIGIVVVVVIGIIVALLVVKKKR